MLRLGQLATSSLASSFRCDVKHTAYKSQAWNSRISASEHIENAFGTTASTQN